ncbi:MAG: GNAT family N-acetyltransferase [Acidiferrobacterales bacterium]
MKLEPPFRKATVDDCYKIAELFRIASGGVAEYVWTTLAPDYPGLTPIEIGAKRYASDQTVFSYKNTVVVELDGKVAGILVTFPIEEESGEDMGTTAEPPDRSGESDVLEPYSKLEAPASWYICAMAFFPEFRGLGLGTQLLSIARQQAQEKEYHELSLIAFERNTGAVRLYERNGFKVIDRASVVSHELIHYTGDALLMTAPV